MAVYVTKCNQILLPTVEQYTYQRMDVGEGMNKRDL